MLNIWTWLSVGRFRWPAWHLGSGSTMFKRFDIPSLKLTQSLKIDPWKRRFLLKTIIFRGELLVSGKVLVDPGDKAVSKQVDIL